MASIEKYPILFNAPLFNNIPAQELSRLMSMIPGRVQEMKTLRQKLSSYILDLSKKQKSEKIFFDYNLVKLAELFSVARPSLSRELARMADDGFYST